MARLLADLIAEAQQPQLPGLRPIPIDPGFFPPDLPAQLPGLSMAPEGFAAQFGPSLLAAGREILAGKKPGRAIAKAGGKLAGGKAGAAVGTAIAPGIGTAIGSGIGSVVGGLAGGLGGKKKKEPRFDIPMAEPSEPIDFGFLRAALEGRGGFLPGFQGGASSQAGGPAIVGEEGPEVVFLAPETPVLPLSQMVEQPAAQFPDRGGFLSALARGLGENPFSQGGSLGPLTGALSQAFEKRGPFGRREPNVGADIGLGALGAAGNFLFNRELMEQKDVEELNQRLRERAAERNKALIESQTKAQLERDKELTTIREEARKRRFMLGAKTAERLGLPAGTRVDFDDFIKAAEKAKEELPQSEFALAMRGTPEEWKRFIQRKTELTRAITGAKEAGEGKLGGAPAGGDVDTLVDAVAMNQAKLTDFDQPTRRQIVLRAAERGERFLPEKPRNTLASTGAARSIVGELETLSKRLHTSTGRGRFAQGARLTRDAIIQDTSDPALYQKARQSFLATLARASGERGTMTDRDIIRAEQLLPTFFASKNLAQDQFKLLRRFLQGIEDQAIRSFTTSAQGLTEPAEAIEEEADEEWDFDASGKLVRVR